MARKPFIAGNWKMNKTPDDAGELAREVLKGLLEDSTQTDDTLKNVDVGLCPTFVCLAAVRSVVKSTPVKLGAQNVYWEESGAFTGEIGPGMLKAAGCQLVIVGHSERRQFFGETDDTVNRRLKAALAAGLEVIVCVGETLQEREDHRTEEVVNRQVQGAFKGIAAALMSSVTIAYEPVWAIGTGKTATPGQAQEVHAGIRGLIAEKFGGEVAGALRIQYGGSVKPDNAVELLGQQDIDGALVGGASLKAKDFVAIVKAALLGR